MRGPRMAVLLCAIAAALVVPGSAHAAFPGEAGDIVSWGLGESQLTRYGPDGTPRGVVPLTPAADWTDVRTPAWSPDGTTLAFISYHAPTDRWRLATVSAAGGTPRVLFSDRYGVGRLAWSPDGRWLAFTHHTWTDPTGDLYVAAIDDGRIVPLLRERDFGVEGQITWSPDCSTLAFAGWRNFDYLGGTTAHPTIDVWRMDLPSRTRDRLTFEGIRPAVLEYSPDGRTLLVSERVDVPIPDDPPSYLLASRLQTMAATGGPRTTIHEPTTTDSVGAASWSPDGARILHVPNWMGMWTMAPDGSDRRRLTADGTATWVQPAWQPLPRSAATVTCDPLGERPASPPVVPPPTSSSSSAPTPQPGRPARQPTVAPVDRRPLARVDLGWSSTRTTPRLRLRVRSTLRGRATITLQRRNARSWRTVGRPLRRNVQSGMNTLWITGMLGSRPWNSGRYRVRVALGSDRRTSPAVTVARKR